ncbi:MAG: hypothetical protein ABIS43_17630 [Opitutus sp.]
MPERNEPSLHVFLQTQQMLNSSALRIRHVDYDNAPEGRDVNSSSAARWWLGLIAKGEQAFTSKTSEQALESAALWSEPALQLCFLIFGTLLVSRRMGAAAATVFVVGAVCIYPFSAAFLPGAPDPRSLARVVSLSAVVVIALEYAAASAKKKMFGLAGGLAGLALWADAATAVPILAGTLVGGVAAALVGRVEWSSSARSSLAAAWRTWSLTGAAVVLACYLVEYAPYHFASWNLNSAHPLYGIALLGMGQLIATATTWNQPEAKSARLRQLSLLVLAGLAVGAIPAVAASSGAAGYVDTDFTSIRLSSEPGAAAAKNFWAWLSREGLTIRAFATVCPLGLLAVAAWAFGSHRSPAKLRVSLVLVLGPTVIATMMATQKLSWWTWVGGGALILAVLLTEFVLRSSRRVRVLGSIAGIAIVTIGAVQIWRTTLRATPLALSIDEAGQLIERDLARWLAQRSGEPRPVTFAPPHLSLTFAYFAGLRGLGTFAPENQAGFGTALTLAGVKRMEEVQGIVESRGVRYIVIPSWDPFFDEFAQQYLAASLAGRRSFLAGELRRFNLPDWIRPLAYPMPVISGFEQQWVLVFEVVEPQSAAVANSRLAEYFAETGDLDRAAAVSEALRKYPGDLGAIAARAQVLRARGDVAGFSSAIEGAVARLANGADRFLPWDRRVSLAIVLAQAERIDLAREQVRRCLADLTEARLRLLSADAVFGLFVLSDSFGIPLPNAQLREQGLKLLPRELQERLLP